MKVKPADVVVVDSTVSRGFRCEKRAGDDVSTENEESEETDGSEVDSEGEESGGSKANDER